MKENQTSCHIRQKGRLHVFRGRFLATPHNYHKSSVCHFPIFHRVLDGKMIHKHVKVSAMGDISPPIYGNTSCNIPVTSGM